MRHVWYARKRWCQVRFSHSPPGHCQSLWCSVGKFNHNRVWLSALKGRVHKIQMWSPQSKKKRRCAGYVSPPSTPGVLQRERLGTDCCCWWREGYYRCISPTLHVVVVCFFFSFQKGLTNNLLREVRRDNDAAVSCAGVWAPENSGKSAFMSRGRDHMTALLSWDQVKGFVCRNAPVSMSDSDFALLCLLSDIVLIPLSARLSTCLSLMC